MKGGGLMSQVGIDVGGTFTDAVLLKEGSVEKIAKIPTETNLLHTLSNALDELDIAGRTLEHITVSTTLVTNAILQNRLPEAKLFLLPGSGMKLEALPWPVAYEVLSGEIDYRGREVSPPNELEWYRAIRQWYRNKVSNLVAVVGKFSHRNRLHEEQFAAMVTQADATAQIAMGHIWGQANFYRRSLTTYLNLASRTLFSEFAGGLEEAVAQRGIQAPIAILKADGGIQPLSQIRPVETIYSGPAASVLGALAQNEASSFVVIDIGGTTTDLGIVLSNSPLPSSRGAKIGSFPTLVRSLAVRSVPIGGDSVVFRRGPNLVLAGYRQGPAVCLGGSAPTPTDAMCYLGLVPFGDRRKAEAAMASLLEPTEREPQQLTKCAEHILHMVADRIAQEIESLEKEWQEEPAYKVWEVLHPHEALQFHVWASGGAAAGLKNHLQKRLHTEVRIGKVPEVSNAIGAALARPTFSCTLHLDTFLRRYRIEETGEQGVWDGSKRPHSEIEAFLQQVAKRMAMDKGVDLREAYKDEFDFFPIVQGFKTVGQIVRGGLYVPPGVKRRLNQ